MSPAFLLTLLVAALVGLIPVWRLHLAGWPARSLFTAWVLYGVGIFVAVRFPAADRYLAPILVLAYIAPFVAGPERLSRVLNRRRRTTGVIIDVTPRPAPGLPEPRDRSPDEDPESRR